MPVPKFVHILTAAVTYNDLAHVILSAEDTDQTPTRAEKAQGYAEGFADDVAEVRAENRQRGVSRLWGWGDYTLTVTLQERGGFLLTPGGRDHLGQCSYLSPSDFMAEGGYFPDMLAEAGRAAIKNAGYKPKVQAMALANLTRAYQLTVRNMSGHMIDARESNTAARLDLHAVGEAECTGLPLDTWDSGTHQAGYLDHEGGRSAIYTRPHGREAWGAVVTLPDGGKVSLNGTADLTELVKRAHGVGR